MNDVIPSAKSSLTGAKLRAKERVLDYLQTEFSRPDVARGARLPASRALAKELGVSVSTVQTVFRMLAKQGIISTEVGNGSFLINPPGATTAELRLGVTFGLLEGNQPTDAWHLSISGAILNHAATLPGNVSVVPMDLSHKTASEAAKYLAENVSRVDGVILKPFAGLKERLDSKPLSGIPIVHLNPPTPSATANFVSADYLDAYHRIGKALLAGGRKRILFLPNMETGFGAGDFLRNAGLTGAIGTALQKEVDYTVVSADGNLETHGYEAARRIFGQGGMKPDAVVCAGDGLAEGVWEYCREHSIKVPDDVSIVGGTGMHGRDQGRGLTRARQPVERIGVELVELVRRIRLANGKPQPGLYLPIEFIGGDSTTARENDALQLRKPA